MDISGLDVSLVATSRKYPLEPGTYDHAGLMSVAFAHDGRLAAAYDDGSIRLFDTTETQLRELGSGTVAGGTADGGQQVTWEADWLGWTSRDRVLECIATKRIGPGRLQTWLVSFELPGFTPVHRWPLTDGTDDGSIRDATWAQEADVWAVCDRQQQIVLRRLSSPQVLGRIPAGSTSTDYARWNRIALTDEGLHLAAGATDRIGMWRLVDYEPSDFVQIEEPPLNRVQDLAWSPNGDMLAWCRSDASVVCWQRGDTGAGRRDNGHEQKTILLLDHPTEKFDFNGFDQPLSILKLAWSVDGVWLAGLDVFGTLYFWHPRAALTYTSVAVSKWTASGKRFLAWGPNGLLASPGESGELRLWRVLAH